MKPRLLALMLPAALAVLAAPAAAQFTPQATASPGSAPQGINYQGRLEDNGFPATGSKTMVFRVFDVATGGAALWTSPAQAVDVQIGLFNAVVPVPLTALVGGGSRYLEVQIDGTVMSPRELLNSVPYALIAKSVEGTIDVSTAGLSVLANSAATAPALHISSQTGNVGVGTSSPAAAFDVDGAVQFGQGAAKSTFTAAGDLRVARNVTVSSAMATGNYFSVGGSTLVVRDGRVSVGLFPASARLHVAETIAGADIARFDNTGTGSVLTLAASGRFTNTLGGIDSRWVLGPNAQADAGVTGHDYAGLELGSAGLYSAITSGGSGINGGVRELYFFTNNDFSAAKMHINTAGRVGISTQSPQAQLDVQGNAQFGSGATKSTFTASPGPATAALQLSSGVAVAGGGPVTLSAGGFIRFGDGTAQASAPRTPTLQTFTANGTWNRPAGVTKVFVEVWGAGGGGGFRASASPSQGGGGGGGGGYCARWIDVSATASAAVTVGTGGTGGTSGTPAGGTGGSSSFFTFCGATGGAGGDGNASSADGGAGGTGSSGDVNMTGSAGAVDHADSAATAAGGIGGAAPRGGGGGAAPFGANGSAGGFPGGGGGSGGGPNGADRDGGAGAGGLVIVTEY